MLYLHPDQLFQTRSGITPHVLWGVPFSSSFFGESMKDWETSARNLIYALFQMTFHESSPNGKAQKNDYPELLSAEMIRHIQKQAETRNALPAGAFPILAIARSLVKLAEKGIFTKDEFSRQLDELESLAIDAAALSQEDEPLGNLLLAGELAQTIAYQICLAKCHLPQIFIPEDWNKWEHRAEKLLRQAQKILSDSLDNFLDGAGTPKAELLPIFRMLAASWTRMRWLDWGISEPEPCRGKEKKAQTTQKLNKESARVSLSKFSSIWNPDSLSNFEWMVRMLIYLTRPDGSLVFSSREEKTAFWCPELFIAALKFDSDLDDKKLAVSILPDLIAQDSDKHQKDLPDPSNHSPWGRIRIMQKSWKSRTGATISWDTNYPRIEIVNRKRPLISGKWSFEGYWNKKPLSPLGKWKILFSHSTDEAEYLELEMKLSEDFSLQRQFLLAKKDRFLLLGEAVSKDNFHGQDIRNGTLRWTSTLPCLPNTIFRQDCSSLELHATAPNGSNAMFLPLAFPEWRTQLSAPNRFSAENHFIHTSLQLEKSAFYSPVFIDLNPQRTHSALTWRRLSVGEKLQNLPPHLASGFRVQIDDEQWLIYRAMKDTANRSVLGKNLNSETFIGRFTPIGDYETIIEVMTTHEA